MPLLLLLLLPLPPQPQPQPLLLLLLLLPFLMCPDDYVRNDTRRRDADHTRKEYSAVVYFVLELVSRIIYSGLQCTGQTVQ